MHNAAKIKHGTIKTLSAAATANINISATITTISTTITTTACGFFNRHTFPMSQNAELRELLELEPVCTLHCD